LSIIVHKLICGYVFMRGMLQWRARRRDGTL
jgi:hypothetical protein